MVVTGRCYPFTVTHLVSLRKIARTTWLAFGMARRFALSWTQTARGWREQRHFWDSWWGNDVILAFIIYIYILYFFFTGWDVKAPRHSCVFGLHMCWRSLCTDVYEGSLDPTSRGARYTKFFCHHRPPPNPFPWTWGSQDMALVHCGSSQRYERLWRNSTASMSYRNLRNGSGKRWMGCEKVWINDTWKGMSGRWMDQLAGLYELYEYMNA